MGGRFLVGVAFLRASSRPEPVGSGGLREARLLEMMREKFGLKFGRLRRTMLQELGDVAVQQLAPARALAPERA